MNKKRSERRTTAEKVAIYETTVPLLKALYSEIQELSKKKPDATLNASKVTLVNRLLTDMKKMLADEPDDKYLDLLDDAALPQYSDVVIILSQYVAAAKRFRETHYDHSIGAQEWILK